MKQLLSALIFSSLGRKFVMAITGLGAIGFLAGHLGGNLLIFGGPKLFNQYAEALHAKPQLLAVAEIGLFLLFMLHIVFAVWLTLGNWAARPGGYAVGSTAGGAISLVSKTMFITGVATLLFIIIHLLTLKFFPPAGNTTYERVVRVLGEPLWGGLYLIGIVAVGAHLVHGAHSTLQSLGARHPRYDALIEGAGQIVAVALSLGFVAIAVYVMVRNETLLQLAQEVLKR